MQGRWRTWMAVIATTVAGSACTNTDSATNLNPAGPPMLRQVRLNERVINATDPSLSFSRRVFGFGSHELAGAAEIVPEVTNAVVVGNNFRLIIDELLVGNNLEEIACRSAVDDDVFQRVPLGANPDDIARCAVADDVLPSSCTGATAVCICDNDLGCLRGTTPVAKGEPVGVLDVNQDGATDDTRFIAGVVGIKCGTINVPIDLDGSYWNPSGDQNKPAMGGFDALGPAINLQSVGALPTNLPCTLVFAPEVVDKENRQICAPAGGDVTLDCVEGDTSAFGFRTEALTFGPASWAQGETGVNRMNPALFSSNAPLLAASTAAANITVTQAGVPFNGFTTTLMMPQLLSVVWTAQLAANTEYTVTFTPAVTDLYQQGVPAPLTFTFTTGNN